MLGIDPRAVRVAWTIVLMAVALFLLWELRRTLLILVCALLLAYLLAPLVDLVERFAPRRIPRNLALASVYVTLVTIVALLGVAIGARIAQETGDLVRTLPPLLKDPERLRLIPLPLWVEPYRESAIVALSEQVRAGAEQAIPFLTSAGGSILAAIGSLVFLVLIPILSFLFLKDAEVARKAILELFPTERRETVDALLDDIHRVLTQFMRALVLVSLATFVAYAISLSILGVRYALLLSLIAALFEFVPVAGPLAASIVILIVAVFSGNGHIVGILLFLVIYRLFQDYVLQPQLMSAGVAVSPLMVIFGVLAGEQLAGVAGMFLSIPVLAILRAGYLRLVATRRPPLKDSLTP